MRRAFFIFCLTISLCACKSKKKAIEKPRVVSVESTPSNRTVHVEPWPNGRAGEDTDDTSSVPAVANDVIKTALTYSGTRYKYGGTTKKGMDCSGLVYTSFKEHDISLQRASYMMATQGRKIKLREIRKGDLVFFKTGKQNRINHVGLVVEVRGKDIRFIHSTSSRGVLISSIQEGYWNHSFTEARRIL